MNEQYQKGRSLESVHKVTMSIEALDLHSFEAWGLHTPKLRGLVLTSNFSKFDVVWIMKQSALCVNKKADSQQQLPMKPEA